MQEGLRFYDLSDDVWWECKRGRIQSAMALWREMHPSRDVTESWLAAQMVRMFIAADEASRANQMGN